MRFHRDAIAATIGIGSRAQRLMNVADQMNEKGEIAVTTPFVAIALFEAVGVFVDLRGDARSARTACRPIASLIPVGRCR